MVIAPESSDSQESNISDLLTFWDITFFCQFLWLTIFDFVRAISWSPAFANIKIVVIALCRHAIFLGKPSFSKNSLNMGIT